MELNFILKQLLLLCVVCLFVLSAFNPDEINLDWICHLIYTLIFFSFWTRASSHQVFVYIYTAGSQIETNGFRQVKIQTQYNHFLQGFCSLLLGLLHIYWKSAIPLSCSVLYVSQAFKQVSSPQKQIKTLEDEVTILNQYAIYFKITRLAIKFFLNFNSI